MAVRPLPMAISTARPRGKRSMFSIRNWAGSLNLSSKLVILSIIWLLPHYRATAFCTQTHSVQRVTIQALLLNLYRVSSYDFSILYTSNTLRVVFITESALRDIECIPSFTRHSANSG